MKYFGDGLSEQHKELNRIIRKAAELERSRTLFLDIHAKLNLSIVSNTEKNEVDNLLYDLSRNEYAIMPTSKDETIAWVLWHIVRELIDYRNAVAKRTRDIVSNLNAVDLKRKVCVADLDTILSVGGVTLHENSKWLLDFWGKKDVAGLLLMPSTRDVMLHLNDCCKWKVYIRTKKKFYRS